MTRDEILTLLDDAGLGHHREKAGELLQTAISLRTVPTPDAQFAVGDSKMGGWPDLPPSTPWPRRGAGTLLSFLGQINFADAHAVLPDSPLPPSGLLSLFYDADEQPWGRDDGDEGGYQVLYTPEVSTLEHVHSDLICALMDRDGLPEIFKPCALQFTTTLPIGPLHSKLPLTNDERKKLETVLPDRNRDGDGHQMLGKPNYIQNDTDFHIGMKEVGVDYPDLRDLEDDSPLMRQINEAAARWPLLLQIDSDDNPGWMWGDVGLLYFHIHETDLALRNFSNVEMELQCC